MNLLADNLLPYGGELYYFPGAISSERSEDYFNQLFAEIKWRQEPVKIFGKEVMQPRLTSWYGDKPYTYSGITMQPNRWVHPLPEIKSIIEKISGSESSSALLNLYRDGNDGMGWHRDNEKSLGAMPVIASVSLGAARTFKVRDYKTKKPVISLELQPGSVVVMKGEMQQVWEHSVPKTAKVCGARINITFRNIFS